MSSSPSPSPSTRASVDLTVEGMHCGSCAALIEETLAEIPGVRAASVDLESALASVDYDPSALGVDALTAAIAGAGYPASPVR